MRAEYTSEFVERAAAGILSRRPAYAELIGFYAAIFAAQEDARPRIGIEPFRLDPGQAAARLREGFALIRPVEMRFDPQVAAALLNKLCAIAVDRRAQLAAPAEVLSGRPEILRPLFQAFIGQDNLRVGQAAESLGVDPQALSFFLYHSLRPAFRRTAEALDEFLPDAAAWERGACPVCGSPPVLSLIEGEGERRLHCAFCWHDWPVPRLFCPACENRDPQALSYLSGEEEPEYRIELCESCRKHLKTVDVRRLTRLCYPPLEQIATLHLDLEAAEAGTLLS